jgi:hypothetical protein
MVLTELKALNWHFPVLFNDKIIKNSNTILFAVSMIPEVDIDEIGEINDYIQEIQDKYFYYYKKLRRKPR